MGTQLSMSWLGVGMQHAAGSLKAQPSCMLLAYHTLWPRLLSTMGALAG